MFIIKYNPWKIILVGSEDFTLMGRPIVPRDLASIHATCVEGLVDLLEKVRIFFWK